MEIISWCFSWDRWGRSCDPTAPQGSLVLCCHCCMTLLVKLQQQSWWVMLHRNPLFCSLVGGKKKVLLRNFCVCRYEIAEVHFSIAGVSWGTDSYCLLDWGRSPIPGCAIYLAVLPNSGLCLDLLTLCGQARSVSDNALLSQCPGFWCQEPVMDTFLKSLWLTLLSSLCANCEQPVWCFHPSVGYWLCSEQSTEWLFLECTYEVQTKWEDKVGLLHESLCVYIYTLEHDFWASYPPIQNTWRT